MRVMSDMPVRIRKNAHNIHTRYKEEPDFATKTPAKIKTLLPNVEVKFIKY